MKQQIIQAAIRWTPAETNTETRVKKRPSGHTPPAAVRMADLDLSHPPSSASLLCFSAVSHGPDSDRFSKKKKGTCTLRRLPPTSQNNRHSKPMNYNARTLQSYRADSANAHLRSSAIFKSITCRRLFRTKL